MGYTLPIDATAIDKLRNYVYKSEDESVIAPYYTEFAYHILAFIPLWVSPNVISLIGLSFVIFSSLLNLFFSASISFTTLCFINVGCLFAYQMCDILDGRQAYRLTMETNPTTDVFDHGCDSVVLVLACLNSVWILDITFQAAAMLLFLTTCTLFYLPTWQNLHTKCMVFRSGLCNPTESLVAIQVSFLLTGLFPSLFRSSELFHFVAIICLGIYCVICAIDSHDQTLVNGDKVAYKSETLFPLTLLWTIGLLSLQWDVSIYYKIITVAVPWLITIMDLTWSEMSGVIFNLPSMVIIIMLHFFVGYKLLIFSIPVYFIQCTFIVNTICGALKMKYFWSVPSGLPVYIPARGNPRLRVVDDKKPF